MAGANSLFGPLDPAADAGYTDAPPRMGFFTDTSVCIGCKACEVACKEWNGVPEDGLDFTGESYDNTSALGADTWRHLAFERLEVLHVAGESTARLYGEDPDDGVGGQGSIFLLLDEPEVYGLPPDPVSTTRDLGEMWRAAAAAGAAALGGRAAAADGGRAGGGPSTRAP